VASDDTSRSGTERSEWNARADEAERAVIDRYVRSLPGIAWGRSAWPPLARRARTGGRAGWHYWWSAHLVEAAVDAALHRPSPARRRRARALARGIRLRNGGWSRTFYDDIAWLGLAFERGGRMLRREKVAEHIAARLQSAIDPAVGALPWSVGSRLFNAPANGPASILLARTRRRVDAARLADWLDETLRDPDTGLVLDGVVVEDGVKEVRDLYTYCQGVVLGAELAQAGAADSARFTERAVALIAAIATWTGPSLVLPGSGGGDGGLFAAIACRYLAGAAVALERAADAAPSPTPLRQAAASARAIVVCSAGAAWEGRVTIDGLALFSADWRSPADASPGAPERDLSVQLAGWLVLEAAVDATGPRSTSEERRNP
jgi:predicted alpha-1,6-mannanase (GH76 family)